MEEERLSGRREEGNRAPWERTPSPPCPPSVVDGTNAAAEGRSFDAACKEDAFVTPDRGNAVCPFAREDPGGFAFVIFNLAWTLAPRDVWRLPTLPVAVGSPWPKVGCAQATSLWAVTANARVITNAAADGASLARAADKASCGCSEDRTARVRIRDVPNEQELPARLAGGKENKVQYAVAKILPAPPAAMEESKAPERKRVGEETPRQAPEVRLGISPAPPAAGSENKS